MRPGVLIMYIYSYLYYDVTQVTIIKDYLLTYLQSGEMLGILSAQQNLGKLKSPNTHVWHLTVDTIAIDLLNSSKIFVSDSLGL